MFKMFCQLDCRNMITSISSACYPILQGFLTGLLQDVFFCHGMSCKIQRSLNAEPALLS